MNPYAVLSDLSGDNVENVSMGSSPRKPLKEIPEPRFDDDIDDKETFDLEFKQHKRHYYMEKFDLDIVDELVFKTVNVEVVKGS